jgi:hypothetical protein
MKRLFTGFICLSLACMYRCQKHDCQTFIQAGWHVVYPADSSYIAVDSAYFYQGDSIMELYKLRTLPDSFKTCYSSYYITSQCDEIDFMGGNSWDTIKKVYQYHIIQVDNKNFRIISKADSSSCIPCIVTLII